jgi:transcriptional regulator of acetoin/glycerol metabolism
MATSRRRCLTEHHLDPEIQAAPHIITDKELRDSREPLRNLILHAEEELDRLYAIVGPQQSVVLLCDRDGVAIHHSGDESLADADKDCGIWGSPNEQRPGREAAVPLALREPNGARTQKLLGLRL